MTDEEFKAAVIGRFDGLDARFDGLDARFDAIDGRLDAVDRRFDAIVARLDEQDAQIDNLAGKVDRLTVMVRASLDASEQALSSALSHGRRITKLEHPEGGH